MYQPPLAQTVPADRIGNKLRNFALLKMLALLFEMSRASLVLLVKFPKLESQQKLKEIQHWAKNVLDILQINVRLEGVRPAPGASLVVSNHVSWLDVLVLQSLLPGVFVAKSDVRRWPLIGTMAQVCSTIFVERSSRKSARSMVHSTLVAFDQGYSVIAFPEGTSSDGSDLGVFHANIFEAAIQARTLVQPVTLRYLNAHTGLPDDSAVFIGDTTLASSLRKVMSSASIRCHVHLGEHIKPLGHSRKTLASQAHQSVRRQLQQQRQGLLCD
jgi:1-acyl-sn-glycerol-3-phosphate acyltransferase